MNGHVLPYPTHLNGVVRTLGLLVIGVAVQSLHSETVPQVPHHVSLETAAAQGLPVDPPAGSDVTAGLVDLYPDGGRGQELEPEVGYLLKVIGILEGVLGHVADEVAGWYFFFDLVAQVDCLGCRDDRFVVVVVVGEEDEEEEEDDDDLAIVVVGGGHGVVAEECIRTEGMKK